LLWRAVGAGLERESVHTAWWALAGVAVGEGLAIDVAGAAIVDKPHRIEAASREGERKTYADPAERL